LYAICVLKFIFRRIYLELLRSFNKRRDNLYEITGDDFTRYPEILKKNIKKSYEDRMLITEGLSKGAVYYESLTWLPYDKQFISCYLNKEEVIQPGK
jgi:hypothetical protein